MRGPRTPADLLKLVLSREGYFCAIPGCTNLAEFGHHIVFRVHGGATTLIQLIGVCKECHDAGIHQGYLLVSGTAEKLIISGKGGLPLASGPDAFPPSVKLEVEAAPRLELPDPAVASPAIASPAGENQIANAVSFTIPAEISPAWWLEHRRYFEWSDRQRVLIARFDRESPECPAMFERQAPGRPALPQPRELHRSERDAGEPPPPDRSGEDARGGPRPCAPRRTARGVLPPHPPEGAGQLQVIAGPALTDPLALLQVLVSLRKGDVLFIDEIHGLPRPLAECFYPAIDDGAVSLPVICGGETRSVKLRLEPFFLIGATTEEAQLPKPLHSRFALRERLDLYSTGELAAIAMARGRALGVEVTPEAAETLARGSRGTPRELVAAVSMARDQAQVAAGRAQGVVITPQFAEQALRARGIDRFGLSEIDRRILRTLADKTRAIGLRTLADILGESPRAMLEVHEPYLLRAGLLVRTHRGRALTAEARRLLPALGVPGRRTA